MLYRVMLADDEPIMRKALLTLTDWQYIGCEVVYTAENGQEVLDNLEQAAPDILITDIKMPGEDGIGLARYIWEKKLPVKVIILTAYADFSYAQSAVKYGVADYIVKTGLFDGLITAVENAKSALEEEQKLQRGTSKELVAENFFKSVFDGSLYEEDEIETEYRKLDITIKQYVIILLRFRVSAERKKRGMKEINKSLMNFLSMVFSPDMVCTVPVEKDMYAIVLNVQGEHYEWTVRKQCRQVIDMMDNFMKLYAYMGVSQVHERPQRLKKAYDEAEYVMECSFADWGDKLDFYKVYTQEQEVYPAGMDQHIERLCTEMHKGDVRRAQEEFNELIKFLRDNRCSAHLVKSTGILLQSRCSTILADYDRTISEITGRKENVPQLIDQCRHMEEFTEILMDIIKRTAETIHIAVNKKETLVYECQMYIESHYEKNIMVTDIARQIGASASYLSRIFKEITGQTIIATLNRKKVERAKEYLDHTDMKIYEIADKLGFENAAYFSHFFKKYTGMSPKEYKEGV